MKRLLIVAVLVAAFSQVEAMNTGGGIRQVCASGYKVSSSASTGYECSPTGKSVGGSQARWVCSKNFSVGASKLMGSKGYRCNKLMQ